jgi:hypothetical protein
MLMQLSGLGEAGQPSGLSPGQQSQWKARAASDSTKQIPSKLKNYSDI